jgi:hypothetical protein
LELRFRDTGEVLADRKPCPSLRVVRFALDFSDVDQIFINAELAAAARWRDSRVGVEKRFASPCPNGSNFPSR